MPPLLPEAVAVMDLGAAGFQDNRLLAALVVPVIGAQGRGVLTFDRGPERRRSGGAARGCSGGGDLPRSGCRGRGRQKIRRYLDRAAFKAAQEGQVVVVGTTRPETIAAILEWTVEGRASTVALAPSRRCWRRLTPGAAPAFGEAWCRMSRRARGLAGWQAPRSVRAEAAQPLPRRRTGPRLRPRGAGRGIC